MNIVLTGRESCVHSICGYFYGGGAIPGKLPPGSLDCQKAHENSQETEAVGHTKRDIDMCLKSHDAACIGWLHTGSSSRLRS